MTAINNNINRNEYRMLDPIKIAWTGLARFTTIYKIKGNYKEKVEGLRLLSIKERLKPEEKEQVDHILETLYKISKCDLCNKEIIWDDLNNKAVSHPVKITGRHLKCHEAAERSKK